MARNFPICAIVAMDEKRAIGKDGQLAWHLPEDLKYFSALTKSHTVLMGRKTFDSLPAAFKPLPHRQNLVLSRESKSTEAEGARFFNSMPAVLEYLQAPDAMQGNCLWIIGGEKIYQLTQDLWDKVYLTRVKGDHNGDVFFPEFEDEFNLVKTSPGANCQFEEYERKGSKTSN
jgi:dihydrofolate reductase